MHGLRRRHYSLQLLTWLSLSIHMEMQMEWSKNIVSESLCQQTLAESTTSGKRDTMKCQL